MSLQTFLSKIWAEIKAVFEGLPADLQQAAQIAVNITEAIKTFDTQNPEVADIITAIIPGDLDNQILAWLREKIPVILTELRLVNSIKAVSDTNQIVALAVTTLQQLDGDIKSAFLHDLSTLIAQEVAKSKNGELNWADAVYIVEWYYQHKYKTA